MQQNREQYGWEFSSRLPTQWMMATRSGFFPSEVTISPAVGPVALERRSNCKPVMMFGERP